MTMTVKRLGRSAKFHSGVGHLADRREYRMDDVGWKRISRNFRQ